ncbi:MAG: DoxX family protein [Planctomycetes bacterium]|nr:DoxX family protein [Planctomycetota bacterium]
MNSDRSSLFSSIGLLIIRLGVGGYMLTHGMQKLDMLREGQLEMMGDPIGLGPWLSLVLVTFAEFACSILVMIGLGTRLFAFPVVFSMGVAAFVAHANDPWDMTSAAMAFFAGESKSWASKEPALIFFFVFLGLMFTGAGRLSLDHYVCPWLKAKLKRNDTPPPDMFNA